MNRSRTINKMASLTVVFFLFAISTEAVETYQAVPPSSKKIAYRGRIGKEYSFGWTASGFTIKTDSRNVNAVFEGKGAIEVDIDGTPVKTIILDKEQETYEIASGLDGEKHTIGVWKRNEGYFGNIRLAGLQISEEAQLFPVDPGKYKLMVIGDSITCGYANSTSDRNQPNNIENENGYMTYGAIAARAIDADVTIISWSGIGIYRNRSEKNDRKNVMPQVFDQTLPTPREPGWDHQKYVPDVIVINLGTNDMHRGSDKSKPALTKEMYFGAYNEFIEKLQTLYSDVKIIVSIGPMTVKPISDWLPELAAGNRNVDYLIFPRKVDDSYVGGHWHPSIKMHKEMAGLLVDKLEKILKGQK